MRYLLDTNIVSDLIRNPQGRAAEQIRKVGEAQVCTSIIVAAELRYGAAKKGSPRLTAQLEAVYCQGLDGSCQCVADFGWIVLSEPVQCD